MTTKIRQQGVMSIRTIFRLSRIAAAILAALGATANAQTDPDKLPKPTTGPKTNQTESVPSAVFPVQLIPNREAVLSSEVSTPIDRLPFRIGDSFNAGDVLVLLDCKEINAKHDYSIADLAELRARREGAVAEFAAAQETHVTKLRLQGLGAAGELEVTLAAAASEKAKAMVKQMDASVDKAQANIRQTSAQILHCVITAPFSGRVARIRIKERELVAANQVIMDIVDVSRLKLQMFTPAGIAKNIGIGAALSIRINGETKDRSARVSRISPRLDGASQVLEVEADLVGSSNGLIAGMLGNARIVSRGSLTDKRMLPSESLVLPEPRLPETAVVDPERLERDSSNLLRQLEQYRAQDRAEAKQRADETRRSAAEERANMAAERQERERKLAEEKSRIESERNEQKRLQAEEKARVQAEAKARADERKRQNEQELAELKAKADVVAKQRAEEAAMLKPSESELAEAKAQAEEDYKLWQAMKAREAKRFEDEAAEKSAQKAAEKARLQSEAKEKAEERKRNKKRKTNRQSSKFSPMPDSKSVQEDSN